MSEALEERIAHLEREVADLSDELARRVEQIERLSRRVGLLMEREADREAEGENSIPLADQKPPHW
ncbi:SlyX family protein [Histidinibacterium aquaticum]|uniref:SlyX family protein n=1 Tax=Histidinibacterium aquaticum TaxID=2613962 RepID=A0A5J5GRY4_9RHOB|nr:SlyX family protein [Histidinibacterium aquaticum]KAA9010423.1 SlyX family protein [Histidinibacterium aquaticum]